MEAGPGPRDAADDPAALMVRLTLNPKQRRRAVPPQMPDAPPLAPDSLSSGGTAQGAAPPDA